MKALILSLITLAGISIRVFADDAKTQEEMLKRLAGAAAADAIRQQQEAAKHNEEGAVAPSHLQGYLDEFAFRFNRRLSTHRGMLFYRLMQQAVTGRPPPIKKLYHSKA